MLAPVFSVEPGADQLAAAGKLMREIVHRR
jgi:hypothetical protein